MPHTFVVLQVLVRLLLAQHGVLGDGVLQKCLAIVEVQVSCLGRIVPTLFCAVAKRERERATFNLEMTACLGERRERTWILVR